MGEQIIKVVRVEVTREGRTERELTSEELKEWKKAHGYYTETPNKHNTEQ